MSLGYHLPPLLQEAIALISTYLAIHATTTYKHDKYVDIELIIF